MPAGSNGPSAPVLFPAGLSSVPGPRFCLGLIGRSGRGFPPRPSVIGSLDNAADHRLRQCLGSTFPPVVPPNRALRRSEGLAGNWPASARLFSTSAGDRLTVSTAGRPHRAAHDHEALWSPDPPAAYLRAPAPPSLKLPAWACRCCSCCLGPDDWPSLSPASSRAACPLFALGHPSSALADCWSGERWAAHL